MNNQVLLFRLALKLPTENPTHTMTSSPAAGIVVQVGTDRVCIGTEGVVIEARERMDWPVREFCRTPVYFEGRKYFVRNSGEAVAPYVRRYELWPWPADQPEQTTRMVIYDAAYVAERDATARARRGGDWWHLILLPFFPFLGLCWSGFKNRVLQKAGFEPRSITSASIALVFNLFIIEGIFVGWLRMGLLMWFLQSANLRAVDLVLTGLLLADTVVRYSQHLQSDVDRPWGFCEWLWPRKRKK